jgi:hypothetical protein
MKSMAYPIVERCEKEKGLILTSPVEYANQLSSVDPT